MVLSFEKIVPISDTEIIKRAHI